MFCYDADDLKINVRNLRTCLSNAFKVFSEFKSTKGLQPEAPASLGTALLQRD